MDRLTFQAIVQRTINTLPPQFRAALDNVIIVIEDRPSKRRGKGLLLGLYEGIPITAWGREFSGKLPDTITLYQENIEHVAASPEDVPRIIRETLLHEIGHHFGLDHDRIGEMEQRWQRQG